MYTSLLMSASHERKLAERVARAARRRNAARTLLLDLDGTLAPLAPTPDAAKVPRPTLQALRRLLRLGWSIAIVSGRPAADARAMVGVRGVKIFGSHGVEGSGTIATKPARSLLNRLEREATELSAGVPGVLVERKPFGIAFHDRQVPRGRLASWRRKLDGWLEGQELAGLQRLDGKRVVELRPEGAHKGAVVARLQSAGRDDSLVGIGDDETDEDMFRALRGKGLSVRVAPPRKRSIAAARLPSPLAVQRFLLLLAELSESGEE
jgi:trehalose-phosphatase